MTPGVVLLGVLAAPLGQPRIHRQGGLLGQAQHLGVGLARQLIGDQGFRCFCVGVGQLLKGLGHGPGLRAGERPVVQPGADAGQPRPPLPRERRGALGRLGGAGQRARQLIAQRRRPGFRQAPVVAAGRRGALAAHDVPDHAELGARGPRLDRRPRPQQADQLVAVGSRAAPPGPRQLVDRQGHRAGRRRGVPRVVIRELREPGVGTRRGRIRDRVAGRRGRRLGIAVGARALPVLLPRLPVHRDPRSMMIIVNLPYSNITPIKFLALRQTLT